MKGVLFFVFAFIFTITLSSQVDLSDVGNNKNNKTKTESISKDNSKKGTSHKTVKKKTSKKKQLKGLKETKDNSKTKANNLKKNKKKKENSKKHSYVFKKQEQNFYKFDEKGNPIVKNQIIKSTYSTLKSDLNIGVENKEVFRVKIKEKGN